MSSKTQKILLTIIILVAVGLRIASFSWNQYIHGDVSQYSVAAESIARRGDFLIDTRTDFGHFYSLIQQGGRFLEHNPLWPSMGAVLVATFNIAGFTALKITSLAFGILLLALTYFYARRIGGAKVALLSVVLCSFSYLLIDYSSNGAFYILQALLYILFLFILPYTAERASAVVGIGAILGAGFLLNQQTVILVGTYALYLAVFNIDQWGVFGKKFFSAMIIALLLYVPWGIRNYLFFGSPLSSIDMAYVWGKLGVTKITAGGIISFVVTPWTYIQFFKESLTFWLPHNLYFINRKLFIEAPISYILFLLIVGESFVKGFFNKIEKRNWVPVVTLVVFHVLLSAVWPIAKFRFLVPILPIICVWASYYVFHFIGSKRLQRALVGAMVGVTIIVSLMAYRSTTAHTYYYGGSITTDNFGKNGEAEFLLNTKIDLEDL